MASPAYPDNYRNDLVCEWTVSSTGTSRITARIIDFEMEDGFDFLTFGNGEESSDDTANIIVRLTGITKIRSVTSSGSQMWINVATDRTGTERGFLIHIKQTTDVQGIV